MRIRTLTSYLFALVLLLVVRFNTAAQCAMCRATVENNVSNGELSIGAGLNTGILYLMLLPYIILGTIAYLWYRNSRKYTDQQEKIASVLLKTKGV